MKAAFVWKRKSPLIFYKQQVQSYFSQEYLPSALLTRSVCMVLVKMKSGLNKLFDPTSNVSLSKNVSNFFNGWLFCSQVSILHSMFSPVFTRSIRTITCFIPGQLSQQSQISFIFLPFDTGLYMTECLHQLTVLKFRKILILKCGNETRFLEIIRIDCYISQYMECKVGIP